jgi:hypothetical protein
VSGSRGYGTARYGSIYVCHNPGRSSSKPAQVLQYDTVYDIDSTHHSSKLTNQTNTFSLLAFLQLYETQLVTFDFEALTEHMQVGAMILVAYLADDATIPSSMPSPPRSQFSKLQNPNCNACNDALSSSSSALLLKPHHPSSRNGQRR